METKMTDTTLMPLMSKSLLISLLKHTERYLEINHKFI